jgi:multicomponent Na+:H+ antiporter subunit D
MDFLLILPILIPFVTAIAGVLTWGKPQVQQMISMFGALILAAAAFSLLNVVAQQGIQVMQAGAWPAPFGITLVADLFSAIMVVMAGIMGLVVVVYSLVSIDHERKSSGYYPLLNFLLMGVCGAFMTGDIFNLYVWYEVMLISSFVLLTLGGESAQLEGGIKYVTLNLMASALFLAAVGILYGTVGTLNMADLAVQLPQVAGVNITTALAILFLIAFGIKAALFPLFFWLPASYHTPPIAITVIFSGLLTKVGIYSLIRVFTLIFTYDTSFTHTVILIMAALTMITGVLGAVAQYEMRRLLSFHIVSQIGYLLMGLGLFTPLALAGSIFFMIHVILAKSALFLVGGVLHDLAGTYDLKKLGGFYRVSPVMSVLFLFPALSLAGIPPLSGFWAKLILVRAGLELEQYAMVAAALGVSVLTLFSMIKIWNEAFLKEEADGRETDIAQPIKKIAFENRVPLLLPIAVLAVLMVVIGVGAHPFFTLSMQAAEQLLNPTEYIHAVLGGSV